jgi:M6 family metalloprotease-like protein
MKRIWIVLALTIFFVMGLPEVASANPALSGIKEYTQPDHTVIEYRLMGDEHFNWRETPAGDVILLDKSSKYYCYGQFIDNKITKTAARVGVDNKPFVRLTRKNLLSLLDYSLRHEVKIGGLAFTETNAAPSLTNTNSTSSMTGSGTYQAPLAPAPNQKILVVLVEFANIHITQSDRFWSETFFSDTQNSVHNYYDQNSRGKVSFDPVSEISADATHEGAVDDGVVRVQMNYDHPARDGYTSDDAMQEKISATAIDAVEAAAASIPALSQYDTNGNGILEQSELHVVTIFAGFEMSSGFTTSDAIWGHAADYEPVGVGDLGSGLKLGGYMAVGEQMSDTDSITIGVFCHELGHSLGLPDLYDYGYDSMGLGPHSLMAMGSWGAADGGLEGSTPVHLDAWSKIQLGFVTPTIVSANGSYTVNDQTSMDYNVLEVPAGLPGQYFLIERRSLAGYDAGLNEFSIIPGVAIYHIDENVIKTGAQYWEGLINDNEYRKAVDLEEADMGLVGFSEMDTNGLVWDGRQYFTTTIGMNTFGPNSNPTSGAYDKAIVSPFASISANGTQAYPSDVTVKVSTMTNTNSGLTISVPTLKLHASTIGNQTYTGQAILPSMKVHDGTLYLHKGVDYLLEYHNNVFPGKATINMVGIGKYAGVSGPTNFIIVPKTPTSLTLQLNEKYSVAGARYRTIKATWPSVSGATGYLVAYRASTSSTWSGSLVTGTSWSKTGTAGTLYYVKVKPYVVTDGTKRNYSAVYTMQKAVYTLKAPSITLAKYATRSIRVTLGTVYGESGYDILRASTFGGTYSHRAYVAANTAYWNDTTTYTGKTYYYKVRTYKNVNGVVVFSPFSAIKYIHR